MVFPVARGCGGRCSGGRGRCRGAVCGRSVHSGAATPGRGFRAAWQIKEKSGEIREPRENNEKRRRKERSGGSPAGRQAEQLAGANATIAVLQRIGLGLLLEPYCWSADGGSDDDNDDAGASDGGKPDGGQKKKQVKRGPGARSGRRGDYSGLPRFEVFWDFPGVGYVLIRWRGAVQPPGRSLVRGAAGLAGHHPAGRGLPAPL